MSALGRVLSEDRRGALVRILLDQDSYALNDSVLQDALDQIGHRVARDVVRADLAWLEELELVTVERVGHLWLAALTSRGEDVASGRARVPGVKRPSPRA